MKEDLITKELLSEVLGYNIISFDKINIHCIGITQDLQYLELYSCNFSKKINIYELAHKCLIYAWENNYEITPRVMGAEVMSLKTGYQEYLVNRDDIIEPEMFDYRFILLACQWILDNKDLK